MDSISAARTEQKKMFLEIPELIFTRVCSTLLDFDHLKEKKNCDKFADLFLISPLTNEFDL